MHFNGQTFSGNFEQLSLTSKFLGLKMHKSTFFKEKMVYKICLGGYKLADLKKKKKKKKKKKN